MDCFNILNAPFTSLIPVQTEADISLELCDTLSEFSELYFHDIAVHYDNWND